ncbi:hypothetical protein [Pseudonocardia lacus]|nr:hypothetical protein [Pseudonocardia lacus]
MEIRQLAAPPETLDDDHRLVGSVTTTDLVRSLVDDGGGAGTKR